jgi:hypothetical protein
MLDFDDLGRDEVRPLGPKPGKAAVVHHSSGEADFDGLPGDELPPREAEMRKFVEDAPAARQRTADGVSENRGVQSGSEGNEAMTGSRLLHGAGMPSGCLLVGKFKSSQE